MVLLLIHAIFKGAQASQPATSIAIRTKINQTFKTKLQWAYKPTNPTQSHHNQNLKLQPVLNQLKPNTTLSLPSSAHSLVPKIEVDHLKRAVPVVRARLVIWRG